MVFKCKMCGGDIEPIKNTNTGKCIYCKSVMTLPDLDNEKIVNLYNRANSLRLDNEFDKSKEIYEKADWEVLICLQENNGKATFTIAASPAKRLPRNSTITFLIFFRPSA